jgi:MFS transporter, SP family, general alpha glucoside:H+ symporter
MDKLQQDGVDDTKLDSVSTNDLKHVDDAQIAADKEHQLTLVEALKAYPKAIAWSVLLSTAVIMEGFDTVLVC